MMRAVEYDSVRLWLGNARDLSDFGALFDAGVEAIVSLAIEELPSYTREMIFLRFPLSDGDDNSMEKVQLAVESTSFLLANEIPTLIACSAGMSRSPGLAAVALARTRNVSPESVLQTLPPPVDVSPGLWQTLIDA